MGTDVLTRLRTSQQDFSRGQKAIAAYIMEHYDKAAFMTACKLGTIVGVSESTVVRFAVRLGYEGYPDMQDALQDLVRNRLTAVQRLEVTTSMLSDQNVLQAVMNDDMDKIATTLSSVDQAAFNGAVQDTIAARNIYIIGMRSAAGLAQFLSFYFQYIFKNVRLIVTNSTNELYEQLLHVSGEDMVYGISFPRYSSSTVKALEFVRSRGAKIVALTDSAQSPIAPYADYALFARSDMASFVDSLVAPLSVLNALIIAIGMYKKEDVSATFAELERIWQAYGVYETYEAAVEEEDV